MTKSHFVLEKLCPVNPKEKCKILYYPSPNNYHYEHDRKPLII